MHCYLGRYKWKYTFSAEREKYSSLSLTIRVSLKWSRILFRVKSMVALDLGGQNLYKQMCQSNLTYPNYYIIKGEIGGKLFFTLDTSI